LGVIVTGFDGTQEGIQPVICGLEQQKLRNKPDCESSHTLTDARGP